MQVHVPQGRSLSSMVNLSNCYFFPFSVHGYDEKQNSPSEDVIKLAFEGEAR